MGLMVRSQMRQGQAKAKSKSESKAKAKVKVKVKVKVEVKVAATRSGTECDARQGVRRRDRPAEGPNRPAK